ncbi:CHAT domain-containing protein [Suillus ampliporus]|nr:CHAT domain-containing protein [Suillus ampliporus]
MGQVLSRYMVDDVEESRAALQRCPPGHSDRSVCLHHLADALHIRFLQQDFLCDLDEAIELYRAALLLCPPGHFLRFLGLRSLADSFLFKFQHQGILSNLDEAIELYQAVLLLSPHALDTDSRNGVPCPTLIRPLSSIGAALLLCPPYHSDRSMSLNNLAISLQVRFTQRGALPDLDQAIKLHRAVLLLRPPGHSNRSASLNNLGVALQDKFRHQAVLSDLDEAIELHCAALLLRPPALQIDSSSGASHLISMKPLSSIGLHYFSVPPSCQLALQTDSCSGAVPSDLDEAIELYRAALLPLSPLVILNDPRLSITLLQALKTYSCSGASHLTLMRPLSSIGLHYPLCPPGHSDRSACLHNLATSLRERFEHYGILSDLDEATELHRAALLLCPTGHSRRAMSLTNLAKCLRCSFKQRGVLSDLDEAIELHRGALLLCPPNHSNRSTSLSDFAVSLLDRFEQRGVPSDLDETFGLYSQLSHIYHAASRSDLSAAKSWTTSAEKLKHGSALDAYQTALKFLDQHVALLASSSRHFHLIREATSSLSADAFSCGVRHKLVEQGRAVFWTQLARFRTPIDELAISSDDGAVLAEEFKRLSFRLRNVFDQSTEDQSSQIRQLTMQWDDVISRIRMLPDFSRFLLPPLFSDIQKAAEDGPVIIVNASHYSCDALIILHAQDPVHVPLDITRAEVSELSFEFQFLTEQFGSSDHHLQLVSILRKLWDHVVDPVVQSLRESKVQPGSRIWWCPTAEFTLLPLHAAGPYEKKKDNLSHIYISSYTLTLATLIRARQQVSQDASPQHFVAIGQAHPDGGKELRCVAPELVVVAQHVAPVVSFTSLADSHATVQGALDALSRNQWLHLACHGMPNRQQAFESFFAMRDGPLMIKDIIRSDWQNPEFAFLSACHTTVGDEMSPDESIHLAAAMQFSGFRSVIGSMWSVDDEVARQMVSAFYGNLVDDSGRLDCTRAAVALHKAVKSLRKKIPLEQQIVFIHIGV